MQLFKLIMLANVLWTVAGQEVQDGAVSDFNSGLDSSKSNVSYSDRYCESRIHGEDLLTPNLGSGRYLKRDLFSGRRKSFLWHYGPDALTLNLGSVRDLIPDMAWDLGQSECLTSAHTGFPDVAFGSRKTDVQDPASLKSNYFQFVSDLEDYGSYLPHSKMMIRESTHAQIVCLLTGTWVQGAYDDGACTHQEFKTLRRVAFPEFSENLRVGSMWFQMEIRQNQPKP
ncbi:hypothetical protein B0H17DRAFT_1150453 [Mycena rosella]|uniref:Uncharacterized protein n=1 Tax=Mycena rosella TaxID=1033263 RepID=A0AAD7BTT1_MYCRO|nr:hypothetical protein B0H17DRAFT_1150453 [Mycena rosella]